MNIDQLRKQIPDEPTCRQFFEKLIWPNDRFCPHCGLETSYHLLGQATRPGLYERACCKSQFTVTARTPFNYNKAKIGPTLFS